MTTQQSRLKRRTSRRDLNADKNALGNKKKPQLLTITLLTSLKKRRSVTPVKSHISTVIRKATIPATVPSQKTSIGLGNFCIGN